MTKIISCECEEGANDNYKNKSLMQGSPSSLVQPDTVLRKNGGEMARLFRTGTENTKNMPNFGKTTFFASLSSSAELS